MQILPIRDRGYVHPELLAETDWLAGHVSVSGSGNPTKAIQVD